MGDVQPIPGYCLLLPDPVVPSLNHLSESARGLLLSDMVQIGDALLTVTKACRINYEILGNSEPELHAHIFARFDDELPERRRMPVWFYDWKSAPQFSAEQHGALLGALRSALLASKR